MLATAFAQREELNKQLEQLGQNHNDFLSFMYSKTKDNNLSLCDKKSYKILNQWAKDFFASKKANWDGDFVDFYSTNKWDEQPLYPRRELSDEANKYLEKLSQQIDLLNENNIPDFAIFCDDLKEKALIELKSDNEAVVVGSAIAIAKYSCEYWNKHLVDWVTFYSGMPCSPNFQAKMSPTEKKILQADTAGAISGAIGGIAIPPPIAGSVAGALVQGGWASCVSGICIGFKIDRITDWLW